MICHYFTEPSYLIFVNDVPELLYYSHIPVLLLTLLVGFFVFINKPKLLLNQLLLLISFFFAGWTFINLLAWTNIHSDYLLFVWPFFAVLSSFLAVFSIYFIEVFLEKKDISPKLKIFLIFLLTPALFFATTDLSVNGFNISDCDAFGFEGFAYNLYPALLGYFAMIWIAVKMFRKFRASEVSFKKQILLMGCGIELFLLSFFSLNFVASYFANIGLSENSEAEFYGLFGMAFFMIMMGVLIVRFKTFSVGMLSTQALIIALFILVGAQYTYVNSTQTTITLTTIALILISTIGWILIRSVRQELKQRKQIEDLAHNLEKANERLKELDKLKSEFVSIASHQLRSPLTSIRGYASMLSENSFGTLPEKAVEPMKRIEESARLMALAVEDYLNVSRIEGGNMKYTMSEFSLKNEVEKITDDIRPVVMEKGLILMFRSQINSKATVNADIGKTVQIIHNLINNSVKYTPKGSISVIVRDDLKAKKVFVDVSDTGIGISKENLAKLFQKFSRASNANSTNVSGTGLGLFVALKMAEAMGGTITAHSDGDGKGSRFTLELPLVV